MKSIFEKMELDKIVSSHVIELRIPNINNDLIEEDKIKKFRSEAEKISTRTFLFSNKDQLKDILNILTKDYGINKFSIDSRLSEHFNDLEINKDFIDINDPELDKKLLSNNNFIELATIGGSDTSTIFLYGKKINSNHQSLFPEVHIAIIKAENILSYSECISRISLLTKENQNIVAITGPSRTADIEKILVLGVHGPKHLIILIET